MRPTDVPLATSPSEGNLSPGHTLTSRPDLMHAALSFGKLATLPASHARRRTTARNRLSTGATGAAGAFPSATGGRSPQLLLSPGATFSSSAGAAQAPSLNATLNATRSRSTLFGRPLPINDSPPPATHSEYDVAAELLGTYVSRRRVLEKAAQLAGEMRDKADDIAEFEERSRLMAGIGGGEGGTSAKAKVLEAMRHTAGGGGAGGGKGERQKAAQWRLSDGAAFGSRSTSAEFNATTRSDRGHRPSSPRPDAAVAAETGIEVSAAGVSEVETLRQRINAKCEKLDHLRGVQRTIAELDEVVGEKQQSWEKAFLRQQRSVPGDGKAELAANDFDHSAAASHNEAASNAEMESNELRNVFNALVNRSSDEGLSAEDMVAPPPPPSPPSRFTSGAFAVTLEGLGESLAALVEITDSICVAATFKVRDEEVNLNPHMQALVQHVLYTQKAHKTAVRHLERLTAGEKALVDGGAFEVNSLREQFLLRKEALTAQEQRERQTEEARNALRTRLHVLRGRIVMWDEVFFGKSKRDARESLPRASVSHSALHGRHSSAGSLMWLPPSRRASFFGRRASRDTAATERPQPANEPATPSATSTLDQGSAPGTKGSALTSTAVAHPSDPRTATAGALGGRYVYAGTACMTEADEAALERRLARRWGNPYMTKAMLFEQQQQQHRGEGDGAAADALLSYLKRTDGAGGDLNDEEPSVLEEEEVVCGDALRCDSAGLRRGTRSSHGQEGSTKGVAGATLWSAEARATADSRLLSLLQSLVRTIPAAVCGDQDDGDRGDSTRAMRWTALASPVEETAVSQLSFAAAPDRFDPSAPAKRVADYEARLMARNSIHRLIRHLHLCMAKEKGARGTLTGGLGSAVPGGGGDPVLSPDRADGRRHT